MSGGAATGLRLAGAQTLALTRRSVVSEWRQLGNVVPGIVFPLLLAAVYTHQFTRVILLPGFPAVDSFLDFVLPASLVQSVSFGATEAGTELARDIENGFFDRLLLTPGSRVPILVGTMAYSALRSTIPTTGVLLVSALGGLRLPGGPLALVTVYVATAGMASAFCLLGLAVVYRFRTMRSMILIQVCGFSLMFLSTGQVPIHFMNGWLHTVARVNPITNVLRFARQGFLGDLTWSMTWPGLVALGAMAAVAGSLAAHQLRRLAA